MRRLALAALLVASLGRADEPRRLAVYVVEENGQPIVDAAWVAEKVAVANQHFSPTGISFEVAETHPLPANVAEVTTRAQRDALGRGRLKEGLINVFIVGRLADVDEPKDIRGVHWHDRADRKRRFVILSKIAPPVVLAHELGHYFGLPHSTDPVSIMNKTPRSEPPPEERTFSASELDVIRRNR